MKYTPGDRYKIVNARKRIIVSIIDTILDRFRRLLRQKNDQYDPIINDISKIKRILCVRIAYIGDVVMTLPVLTPLRQAFPDAKIDFITSSAAAPLLTDHPAVNDVLTFDAPWFYRDSSHSTQACIQSIRDRQYDLGIDFRGDIRNIFHLLWRTGIPRRLSYISGGGQSLLTHPVHWTEYKHKIEYHLDLLRKSGITAEVSQPRIYVSNEEKRSIRQIIPDIDNSFILIHPGSRLKSKCWPKERFIGLARDLILKGIGRVIFVGGSLETEIISEIVRHVEGARSIDRILTLREFAALCTHARLLVCHDSAPMHIAAAVGCSVVALFGPSCPEETGPTGNNHQIHTGKCERKYRCDEISCKQKHAGACMDSISVDDVAESCLKIMNQTIS